MLRDFFLSILLTILQGTSLSAMAAPRETFSPFVSASVTHDSNLLRRDKSAGNTADSIRQVVAGMNGDWEVARQHIVLAAAINDNRFNRYDTLSYQGRDLQARWNWQLGNHLSGDLGYTNKLSIDSFAYQQSLISNGLVSNLRTEERRFFDGNWLFHPSWQVGMGASKSKLSYPEISQRPLNREDDAWETTLQYLNSASNKVGVKLRVTKGNYPDHAVNFDNGYHQREVLATADWNYSEHSRLQGQAGKVQRKHDYLSGRDYSDITARGTYSWLPTAKVRLNTSAWREVTAYDDLTASYNLNRGMSLESIWAPTSKITVSARIQHEKHAFLGDPGLLVPATNRKDTSDMRKLTVSYYPAQSYSFNVSVSEDKQDSNLPQFSFDSETLFISIIFQM